MTWCPWHQSWHPTSEDCPACEAGEPQPIDSTDPPYPF